MRKFALQKVLDKKGITQYRLAKSLKVSAAEVYRWCLPGYNPTLRTMDKIAKALNVKLDELVDLK